MIAVSTRSGSGASGICFLAVLRPELSSPPCKKPDIMPGWQELPRIPEVRQLEDREQHIFETRVPGYLGVSTALTTLVTVIALFVITVTITTMTNHRHHSFSWSLRHRTHSHRSRRCHHGLRIAWDIARKIRSTAEQAIASLAFT